MTKSYTQFVGLTGLPRTGSTLLSSILSQNPDIHAEGNSPVCQIMWTLKEVCEREASEQIMANRKVKFMGDMLLEVSHTYYRNITETIVVDKCRGWITEPYFKMLQNYIDNNVKILVLERSVTEVVKSFVHLFKNNNISKNEIDMRLSKLLEPMSQPIMSSIAGINWAKKNNDKNTFLFISYNDLVDRTEETITKIYRFCGWKDFKHNFNEINTKYKENDAIYNLKGMHDVRSKITKRSIKTDILPPEIIKKCEMIDKMMGY